MAEYFPERPQMRRRVLVVDDVPFNRQIIASQFEIQGWETVEAGSGEEALSLLAHDRDFAAILMDIFLPGVTGLETTRRLRAEGCNVPVIALTGQSEDVDRESAAKAGLDGYLTKPVSPEILWAEIGRVLAKDFDVPCGKTSGTQPCSIQEESSDSLEDILDYQKLRQFCGNNEKIVKNLLVSFVTNCREYLEEVEQAVKDYTPEETRLICHKIVGAAGTLRAEKLRKAAKQLGCKVREGKTEEVPSALIRLKDEAKRLIMHIESLSD